MNVLISEESSLKIRENLEYKKGEPTVNIQIKNYKFQNDCEWMNEYDLSIVALAMARDLSKVIDWQKSPQDLLGHITVNGQAIPSHFKPFDTEYWKDVSS